MDLTISLTSNEAEFTTNYSEETPDPLSTIRILHVALIENDNVDINPNKLYVNIA